MRGRLTVLVVGPGRTRWRAGSFAAPVVVPASGPSGSTANSWAGSSGGHGVSDTRIRRTHAEGQNIAPAMEPPRVAWLRWRGGLREAREGDR